MNIARQGASTALYRDGKSRDRREIMRSGASRSDKRRMSNSEDSAFNCENTKDDVRTKLKGRRRRGGQRSSEEGDISLYIII